MMARLILSAATDESAFDRLWPSIGDDMQLVSSARIADFHPELNVFTEPKFHQQTTHRTNRWRYTG